MIDVRSRKWVGTSVKRKEDPRLVTGRGNFTDDIRLPGMLYGAILRSPYAHAKIKGIDVSEAAKLPGVADVLTGGEAMKMCAAPLGPAFIDLDLKEYPMAAEKARWAGQPVAAVAASERAVAEDAAELIHVDYEPLPVVADPEKALEPGAPLVYEELGSNVYSHVELKYGDVDQIFQEADMVVRERFRLHRYSSTPLEAIAVLASYNPATGFLTVWSNLQGVRWGTEAIIRTLGVPRHKTRFIMGDSGGAFGEKVIHAIYDNVITCMLSMKTGKPVKYVETRREMMASCGAKGAIYDLEVAVMKDGRVRALRLKDITDEGGGTIFAGYYNTIKLTNITGLYKMDGIHLDAYAVATNTPSMGANRGLSKPHMGFVIERMMDIVAEKLNMDPAELRFRNLVQPHEMPYITPSGNYLESGDFPAVLKNALQMVDYGRLREEQARLRGEGRYIGVGIACSVDPGGANPGREQLLKRVTHKVSVNTAAAVRVDPIGKVSVFLALPNQGQGHETTAAQMVADELGVDYDDVEVAPIFDSAASPWTAYSGTGADLYSIVDVGAIVGAARKARQKMIVIAAHLLEARPEDMVLEEGKAYMKDAPWRFKTVREIAETAYYDTLLLPPGMEPGLHEQFYYQHPIYAPTYPIDEKKRATGHMTYGSQAHIALVEVDVETGQTKVLKYVVSHDCGVLVNPMIVDGQIHGHTSHGISVALGERHFFDENGQLLTATFMDYFTMRATESPNIEVAHVEFPSTHTVIGTKSVGEGPTIPPMGAVANAVEDALKPFGVRITEPHITPDRLWTVLRETRK